MSSRAMQKRLIRIEPDACERYSLSRASIYRLINAGIIKPIKIGRVTRLDIEQADAALGLNSN